MILRADKPKTKRRGVPVTRVRALRRPRRAYAQRGALFRAVTLSAGEKNEKAGV